jgi:lauroyl/myristoyl acyltransferase
VETPQAGAVPERSPLVAWGVRHGPVFLEPVFTGGYALARCLARAGERSAVASNLAAVSGRAGAAGSASPRAVLAVFAHAARSVADVARAEVEGDFIDWEFVGSAELDRLAAEPGGALLLTARLGRFELAERALAERTGRTVVSVWDPGERHDTVPSAGDFAVAMGYEALVAMRGDAVPPGSPAVTGDLFGSLVRFPKAPFELAQGAGVPVYPVFVVRLGWRRYQVRVEAPIEVTGDPDNPGLGILQAAAGWGRVLAPVLRRYAHQWEHFAPVFPDTSDEP